MSINFANYFNKISNSGSDERGKYSGGQAGDQTGREWAIIPWYNRPWNVVLRYPDQKVRELIAELSIKAANNDLIGYDQNQRDTYWQHLKASNYDPSQITIACEADCSAGVIANIKAAGHLLGIPALENIGASYTGDLKRGCQKAGFQVLTEAKYLSSSAYLVPGDILLYEGHHTATNLGIGKLSGYSAATSVTPVATPAVSSSGAVEAAASQDSNLAGFYITTADLNLRLGAGSDKKLILTMPCGSTVKNYGYYTTVNGTKWLLVDFNSKVGYASSNYLKSNTAAAPSSWVGKVTADVLNVRTGAGVNNKLLADYPMLKKDNLVDIFKTVKANDGKDWYYIRIAGKFYGYVSAAYIIKA